MGPNGSDYSTDDGKNWRPLKPGPNQPADADKNWNALSLPFVVGPHGRIGRLRDDAIPATSHTDGSRESGTANEVERYCVWPGQAPSYKIGHTIINQLRDQARASLGPRFDIKAFHDVVLNSGSVPLEVLKGMGAKYAQTGMTA